jgi:4-diphosphocytidyl-2-C-methyl-D-erythritol kinase
MCYISGDDGFHELEMVMTTIDLADRVELELLDEDRIVVQSQTRLCAG